MHSVAKLPRTCIRARTMLRTPRRKKVSQWAPRCPVGSRVVGRVSCCDGTLGRGHRRPCSTRVCGKQAASLTVQEFSSVAIARVLRGIRRWPCRTSRRPLRLTESTTKSLWKASRELVDLGEFESKQTRSDKSRLVRAGRGYWHAGPSRSIPMTRRDISTWREPLVGRRWHCRSVPAIAPNMRSRCANTHCARWSCRRDTRAPCT